MPTKASCVAADIVFHRVQCRDAFQGFGGNGRFMRQVDVIELAPQMGPTSCFLNTAIFIKMMKTGISISLQNAGEVPQMLLGMLAFMVRRIGEPNRWRREIAGGTVIAYIGPQAPSFSEARRPSQQRRTPAALLHSRSPA